MTCRRGARFLALIVWAVVAWCPTLRTLAGPTAEGRCPANWYPWRGACYTGTSTRASWNETSKACRQLGARLAAPHSLEEQEFLWGVSKPW